MSTTMNDNLIGRLVEGMPFADYLAVDAVSASRLKAMRRSAAHAKWQAENPHETEAMRFGSAVHCLLLEGERFDADYMVAGACEATVKASGKVCRKPGKVRDDEGRWFCGVHGDGDSPAGLLSLDDAGALRCIEMTVKAHRTASQLLTLPGLTEVSAFWRDGATGLACKCRADRVVEVPGFGRVCVDLKTTTDASPGAFKFAARSLGYDVAAAHYMAGLAVVGTPCDAYAFVAVETAAPWGVAVYLLAEPDMEKGARQAGELMAVAKAARASGVCPCYGDGFIPLSLPKRDWEYAETSY